MIRNRLYMVEFASDNINLKDLVEKNILIESKKSDVGFIVRAKDMPTILSQVKDKNTIFSIWREDDLGANETVRVNRIQTKLKNSKQTCINKVPGFKKMSQSSLKREFGVK